MRFCMRVKRSQTSACTSRPHGEQSVSVLLSPLAVCSTGRLGVRHLVPSAAVKNSTVPRFLYPTPLFEEKWHVGVEAAIADAPYPVGIDRPRPELGDREGTGARRPPLARWAWLSCGVAGRGSPIRRRDDQNCGRRVTACERSPAPGRGRPICPYMIYIIMDKPGERRAK